MNYSYTPLSHRFCRPLTLSLLGALALGAAQAQAAALVWNDAGPTDTWSTAAGDTNWTPGNVTWSNGSTATFNGAGETITVGAGVTQTGMTVSGAGNYTLGGAGIGGAGGLVKDATSTGTLTLSGANTYTGATTVNAGTLIVAAGGAINSTSAINVNGAATPTLSVAGGSVTTNNQLIIGGVAGGPGAFTISSGSLILNGGGTSLILGSDNSTNNATANATFTQSGGTVTANGNIFTGNSATSSQINISGGTFTQSAGATYLGIVNGGSGSLTISGASTNVSLNALNLGYAPGSSGTVNISDGTLAVAASSVIGGTSTGGTGSWTQTGGAVTFNNQVIVGNTGAGIATISGGTFTHTAGIFYVGVSAAGTLTVSGGSVSLQQLSLGYATAGSGIINVDAGTLQVTSITSRLGGGTGTGTLNFNGGTFKAGASFTAASAGISTVVKSGGAIIDTNGFNVTFNTALTDGSGGGGLTKLGGGTLTLTGANTYTGNTTVTDGILVLSGSGRLADSNTAGQTLTVDSGAVVNYTSSANNGLGNRVGAGSTWTVAGAINMNTAAANTLPTTITLTSGTLSSAQAGTNGGTYGSFFNNQNTVITATGNSFITGTGTGNFGMATGSNLTLSPTGASDSITASIIFSQGNGGTGGIIKTGSGTVILSGANTYTGTTTISAGTLSAGNIVVSGGNSNLGNAATAVTLGSAGAQGTLSYTGNTATYIRGFTLGGAGGGRLDVTTAGQTLTVGTGAVTGTGLFTVGGAGNTTITSNLTHTGGLTKADAGTLTLSGNNTYTGLTTVSAGILALNSAGANTAIVGDNNTGTTDIQINGGTLRLLANEQIADDATIEMSSGTFDLNGRTETISRFVNNGGTFSTGAGQLIGTGASVVWNSGTNTVNDGGLVADRHIQISGGTNTVEGGATGGVLRLDTPGAAPNGFEMSGNSTLTLNSDNLVAGKLLLRGDVSVTDASSNTIANGLGFANHGNVDIDGGTRTFNIQLAGGTLNIGADVVSGIAGGAVTKEGAGTLAFSGTNTYTGATTVNAGTLLVDGSHNAGAGNYTVGGSGKLGGSGAINTTGSVTVDGQITGGDFGAIDTLNITAASVNLNGTYLADINLTNATGYAADGTVGDLITINGDLDLTGGLVFDLQGTNAPPAAGSHYAIKLLEFSGTGTMPDNYTVTGLDLASGQSVVRWGNAYYLVPEPASFALLAMGSLLLLRRPTRRRGRAAGAAPAGGC